MIGLISACQAYQDARRAGDDRLASVLLQVIFRIMKRRS